MTNYTIPALQDPNDQLAVTILAKEAFVRTYTI